MCEPVTHVSNHRFEAIHLRGTEAMNTQNVFDYFKGYAPASIEWINDYSCKSFCLISTVVSHYQFLHFLQAM